MVLIKCVTTMVSFHLIKMTCITIIDMTDSKWAIGTDPATEMGDVLTASNTSLLPHQIPEWKYSNGGKWHVDPELTVTGNIIIFRSLY